MQMFGNVSSFALFFAMHFPPSPSPFLVMPLVAVFSSTSCMHTPRWICMEIPKQQRLEQFYCASALNM